MESRLGHALARARRRLRDVRQGSDPIGGIIDPDCASSGGRTTRNAYLRTLSRRRWSEDLQVERKRIVRGRMACLWSGGKSCFLHVPEAAGGKTAVLRRDPEIGGRLSGISGAVPP